MDELGAVSDSENAHLILQLALLAVIRSKSVGSAKTAVADLRQRSVCSRPSGKKPGTRFSGLGLHTISSANVFEAVVDQGLRTTRRVSAKYWKRCAMQRCLPAARR